MAIPVLTGHDLGGGDLAAQSPCEHATTGCTHVRNLVKFRSVPLVGRSGAHFLFFVAVFVTNMIQSCRSEGPAWCISVG